MRQFIALPGPSVVEVREWSATRPITEAKLLGLCMCLCASRRNCSDRWTIICLTREHIPAETCKGTESAVKVRMQHQRWLTLRCIKRVSPGSRPRRISLAGTLESAQPIQRYSGALLACQFGKKLGASFDDWNSAHAPWCLSNSCVKSFSSTTTLFRSNPSQSAIGTLTSRIFSAAASG